MVEPTPSPRQPLDPIALALGSSGVVLGVLLVLLAASIAVWFIWFLKLGQLSRLRARNHAFEHEAAMLPQASDLVALARRHAESPGGRIVIELGRRQGQGLTSEFLLAVAKRAIATEQQRASVLMPTLSSIASASPFIGLFGTVWGIMDAFLRIDLPEVKAAQTPVKDARLLVSITKEERVLFGEEDVTSHVDQALKENPRVQKEREIYIRADKNARYGIVATVVAAARNSGVESLNLLVEPEVEEEKK